MMKRSSQTQVEVPAQPLVQTNYEPPKAKLAREKAERLAARQNQPKQPSVPKQKKTRKSIPTSPLAVVAALFLLVVLLVWAAVAFLRSPETQPVVHSAATAVSDVVQGVVGQPANNGLWQCPPELAQLEFDGLGVLQPPYPQIQEQPTNYCFRVAEYVRFLELSGVVEDTGEPITGLEWLSQTIAYPNYSSMLDEVREALKNYNLAENTSEIGWFTLPGHGGRQQGTPVPPPQTPDWDTASAPVQSPNPSATPMPTRVPTSTPVPTVAFAQIPVPAGGATPENPAVAQLYPELKSYEDGDPETTNPKLQMYQAMCKAFYDNTDIAGLQHSGIWSTGDVLEFHHDEYGTSALGPIDGSSAQQEFCYDGNCYNIYRREACILSVTGFQWGGSIDHGGGIVSYPDWAQVRKVPLYGAGDGKSNGMECYWLGLWHFPCETTYPQAVPSPTPAPYPTSTPFAGYGSFSDYVTYEWQDPNDIYDDGQWGVNRSPKYWAHACPGFSGTTVRILYGGTCTHEGASHMVNLQDIWDLLDTSQTQSDYSFFVVRCGHPMEPDGVRVAELGSTGVCFGPVK